MSRWRIIQNQWNLKQAPWFGAIGIEEDSDMDAVPSIVCWFTRGWSDPHPAEQVVELHNRALRP